MWGSLPPEVPSGAQAPKTPAGHEAMGLELLTGTQRVFSRPSEELGSQKQSCKGRLSGQHHILFPEAPEKIKVLWPFQGLDWN